MWKKACSSSEGADMLLWKVKKAKAHTWKEKKTNSRGMKLLNATREDHSFVFQLDNRWPINWERNMMENFKMAKQKEKTSFKVYYAEF